MTTKKHLERRVAPRREKRERYNSIEEGILTRNQLTTLRNKELQTIDKASHQENLKELVAYDG